MRSSWSIGTLLSWAIASCGPRPAGVSVRAPAEVTPQPAEQERSADEPPDVAPDEPAPNTPYESVLMDLERPPSRTEPFRLDQLEPTTPLESAVLRVRNRQGGYDTTAAWNDPCSLSTDAQRCYPLLRSMRLTEAGQAGPALYLVTASAGVVEVWSGLARLRQLLGTVDHAAEARLLLFAHSRLQPDCGVQLEACEQRRAEGFELRTVRAPRCATTSTYRHLVSTDGRIKLLDKTEIAHKGRCTVP